MFEFLRNYANLSAKGIELGWRLPPPDTGNTDNTDNTDNSDDNGQGTFG